ncbi:tellurite resistance TerB family protein [Paracoccus seriniphilus]|uniref:Uncharacterized membrane protein YebE, DUF533 family n=1 Tax=Paracoccus seriniphilus TaxID=184748 RepID=A0A239Q2E3_9RHOB|nr:tellurite resistance TerB family protein [Paracoccus seriniphilus]WCR14457.1 tellurite resistance TerB family protein [Paracoccus seriniphilus]SNT76426.1 Uncharacterized membrane protein YebE, DUF533 family [Paracoccus seriniphilus]
MSLMKSLARVAAGVMVAKGIGAVMKRRQQGSQSASPDNQQGGGGLLDSLFGSNTDGRTGSLSDTLGQVLGSGKTGAGTGSPYGGAQSAGAQGGLGGLLDGLTNRARSGESSGGGLSDILGQLTGGARQPGSGSSGGLGDMLGGLLGGAAGGAAAGGLARKGAQESNDASFGELFNDAIARNDEPAVAPTAEQNAVAGLMLKAMIQAAKSDGKIDEAEKQRLLEHLGDELDDEERQFVREQMAQPVDAAGLAREVPKGLEAQVYLMSLLAIDFDNAQEAQYLHSLAQAMGLAPEIINDIHDQVGVTQLYK